MRKGKPSRSMFKLDKCYSYRQSLIYTQGKFQGCVCRSALWSLRCIFPKTPCSLVILPCIVRILTGGVPHAGLQHLVMKLTHSCLFL